MAKKEVVETDNPQEPVIKTAEQWSQIKKLNRFDRAITWAKNRWPVGKELTEEAFDAALKAAKAEVIR